MAEAGRRVGTGLFVLLASVGLVLFFGWVAVQLSHEDDDDIAAPSQADLVASSETKALTTPKPGSLVGAEALSSLVADLRRQLGSSRVYQAVLYPTYAVVDVPAGPAQAKSYRWDGNTLQSGTPSTPQTTRPFELGKVDGEVVQSLSRRSRGLVDSPDTSYVIVGAPDSFDGSTLAAYAMDANQHGGYLHATPQGKVVRRVTW